VIPSVVAARVKLPASTAATKTWIPLNSRLSNAIAEPDNQSFFYDKDAFFHRMSCVILLSRHVRPVRPAFARNSRRI